MTKKISIGQFLFMMLAFAVYASTGIFSKSAAAFPFLSLGYIANFAMVIVVLGVYAVMWQVILKKMPLTVAFLWKNVGLIYGLLISHFMFHEEVTLNNIIGIAIILVGLTIISLKE